jgi:hypothetical protein
MKTILAVLVGVGVLVTTAFVFYAQNGSQQTATIQPVTPFTPTETFAGTIGGKLVIFEHKDYVRYKLTTDGVITEGALNTERGFESDIDATVYVLDWDSPESERSYFVRLTGDDTHLWRLDSQRVLDSDTFLIRQ